MDYKKISVSSVYQKLEGAGLRVFVGLLCILGLFISEEYKLISPVSHLAYISLGAYCVLNCIGYQYYFKSQKVKFMTILLDWLLLIGLLITTKQFMFICVFMFVLFPVDNMFLVKTKHLKLLSVGYIFILACSITLQNFWVDSKMMGIGILSTILGVCLYINNLLNTIAEINEQLAKLATHDILTDLPNRGLYVEHLIHAMNSTANNNNYCSCIFIDLDGFKHVNDTYGHRIGDLLLIEVSKKLKFCLRSEDVVARLGGDEFGLIAQCTSIPEDPIMVSQKILKELKKITNIEGHSIDISASIGVAYYKKTNKEELAVDHFINKADTAMYAAKNAGKRCVRIMNESGEIVVPTLYILEDN